MLGIGAIIHLISGGSKESPEKYKGKKIKNAEIKENKLYIEFSDGIKILIYDNGQSCCETRYMTTDDDLSKLCGAELIDIVAKDGPTIHDDRIDEYHEQVFVEIQTSNGFVTLVNHNEHNGYYGGFGLTIEQVENREEI